MTLTLTPEIEKALTEAAARQGTTPDALAEQALRIRFGIPVGSVGPLGEGLKAQVNAAQTPTPELSPEEKETRRQEALALVRSGYFRNKLSSSETFNARKAEEKALEERHWHK